MFRHPLLLAIFILCINLHCHPKMYGQEVTQTSPIGQAGNPILKSLDAEKIKRIMGSVADWQIKNFTYLDSGTAGQLHDYGIDAWTNATLYLGMFKWSELADDSKYIDWLLDIGEKNEWKMPENFAGTSYKLHHADEICIGQFYLHMYNQFRNASMIKSVRERVDWIMRNPPSALMDYTKNRQSWTWCDAIFMAPPVYTLLASIEQDAQYIEYMHKEFLSTYKHLFDIEEGLFYRDGSYIGKKEANGRKVFWGRGNGWVAAGLVNVLKTMPSDWPYRYFYEDLFRSLLTKLLSLQDQNGFWHASLLDPQSYPAPETSATSLITYALAYGISTGLLDSSYTSNLVNAWEALTSVISEEGKVGFVQPIGADPKNVTAEMTAVYGAGALLLAGVELYNMVYEIGNQ